MTEYEWGSKRERLVRLLYSPVEPLIYATGMEIALSLTSGKTPDIHLLIDSFKNSLHNIWPVSLSSTIAAGVLPIDKKKKYSKREEIIDSVFYIPFAYVILGAVGTLLGGIYKPEVINESGRYVTYAIRTGVTHGIVRAIYTAFKNTKKDKTASIV
jgi:hypothetical protein